MGKYDLRFLASTLAVLGFALATGGHFSEIWIRQEQIQVGDPFLVETLITFAIWSGTAVWMWALGLYATTKGYSAAWGLLGLIMAWPLVGLLPWLMFHLATDRRPDLADALMTHRPFRMPVIESESIDVKYASDALDRPTADQEYQQSCDPWGGGVSERRRQAAVSPHPPKRRW